LGFLALSLAAQAPPTLLEERWSLGRAGIPGSEVRAYKPSYMLLGRWSDRPNLVPQTPTRDPLPLELQETEAKFQVSFKFLVASLDEDQRLTLWGAYTQQSHWQVYSPQTSRPFRETNYEPELFLAWRPDREVFGLHWRLLTFGLNHQSNGRQEPLSRSWNRFVLQAGFERGNFVLLLRPWVRAHETGREDDNPDIEEYLGYGDVVATYKVGQHTLSAQGRLNPGTGHGAVQTTWSFPLQRRLKGYLQVFSGYGESLVDYNWRQTTVGLGICLADWF
jgi:phospholipase A1